MEKSHPNRNQTIPNWIEINPPKSTKINQPTIPPNWSHISIHFLPFCQVDSVVPMDEPLFKATPSEIRFANFASRAECRHSRWGREFPGWGGRWLSSCLVGWLICLICCFFLLFYFVEVIQSFVFFGGWDGMEKIKHCGWCAHSLDWVLVEQWKEKSFVGWLFRMVGVVFSTLDTTSIHLPLGHLPSQFILRRACKIWMPRWICAIKTMWQEGYLGLQH